MVDDLLSVMVEGLLWLRLSQFVSSAFRTFTPTTLDQMLISHIRNPPGIAASRRRFHWPQQTP